MSVYTASKASPSVDVSSSMETKNKRIIHLLISDIRYNPAKNMDNKSVSIIEIIFNAQQYTIIVIFTFIAKPYLNWIKFSQMTK